MENEKARKREYKNARILLKKFLQFFQYSSILVFLFSIPSISYSRPVIADLAVRQIEIDSGFKGTDILLFGARNDPGDIVVVVRGPEKTYTVRKKQRTLGVWVNKKQMVMRNVNGFYVVASNRPLEEIHNDYLLSTLNIGTGEESLPDINLPRPEDVEFEDAFLKKQRDDNLYVPSVQEISLMGDTLFRTVIRFPENIMRGTYTAEIYLFSDGQLSGIQSTPIIVSKKGFDAFVYDFAYKYPLIYGILAVGIALFAGWVAGHIFRKV